MFYPSPSPNKEGSVGKLLYYKICFVQMKGKLKGGTC